ncbi:MAG: phospholipid carrier-dependent glycosyltransferase, partial [Candidatus Dadabacteria bacterium]
MDKKLLLLLSFFAVLYCIFSTPWVYRGLPYIYQEDEGHHLNRTLEMVKYGNWNPKYFRKPSLHFYLRVPVSSLAYLWLARKGEIKKVSQIRTRDPWGLAKYNYSVNREAFIVFNRWFGVFLAVLILFMTGWLFKEIEIKGLSFLAGLALFVTSVPLIKYSATVGADIVMAFFCIAAAVSTFSFFKNPTLLKASMLGALAGLSASSKYNGALILVLPILAVLLSRRRDKLLLWFLILFFSALFFILGSPFILVEYPKFLNDLGYEFWHYGKAGHIGHEASPGLSQAFFYLSWLKKEGGIIVFILALWGILSS